MVHLRQSFLIKILINYCQLNKKSLKVLAKMLTVKMDTWYVVASPAFVK